MRDYLYLWHDSKAHFVVLSGVHLKDIAANMRANGGLLLLTHDYADAIHDPLSRFDYIPNSEIEKLTEQDAYSWGSICWVDYSHQSFPVISREDTAELLYFRHTGEPYNHVVIPSLQNHFLAIGHDDGWFLQIYYTSWEEVLKLLIQLPLLQNTDIREKVLCEATGAFWIDESGAIEAEPTFDIDSVLNRQRSQKSSTS